MDNYIEINKKLWNKRTGVHYESVFYGVEEFLEGKNSLNEIELELIGDVRGKSLLHLQCHFGMDSLSFARLGADVTGIDLSDEAIAKANELKEKAGLQGEFICCDLYDTRKYVQKQFDIVFTSYGTIGWLPDLNKWAAVIAASLKPGGIFVFAEFHPVYWMYDAAVTKIDYSYFKDVDIVEQEKSTYADKESEIELTSISWNHSLHECISALLENGISIEKFMEYDYSPYDIFENAIAVGENKFQIKGLEGKLPLVYALRGKKN